MNSQSSSVSSNPEDAQRFDLAQHNIVFSDTLSRRSRASKSSTSSAASKLTVVSERVNAGVSAGFQTEIPAFSQSHTELRELAEYCQRGGVPLGDIKNYSAQSLASVAYRINSASKLILDLLSTQSNQFGEMTHEMNLLEQRIHQFQERRARHRIAHLTSDKKIPHMRRVTPPEIKERPEAYIRRPIDFTAYDDVGRGFFYELDRTEEYTGPSIPLTLNGGESEDEMQVVPRIVTGPIRNGEINMSAINTTKLSDGSNDIYSLPVTTFHPNTRHKFLQAKSHSIPVHYPAYNASDLAIDRNPTPDIDILRQGHTADSLYDYITPVSRNTPTPWDRSSESASYSGDKDSIKPDDYYPPDQSQLPPPPDYMLTSSPTSTYERMTPQQDRQSPVLEQVHPIKQKLHRIPSTYIEKVITIYSYVGQRYDELSFEPGNVIYVVKKNEDGWYEGFLNGFRGLFPGNYANVVC